jgi:hypothetical protein
MKRAESPIIMLFMLQESNKRVYFMANEANLQKKRRKAHEKDAPQIIRWYTSIYQKIYKQQSWYLGGKELWRNIPSAPQSIAF